LALIKCPDCQKDISDLAEVCIHCGRPIPSLTSEVKDVGTIFSDGNFKKHELQENKNDKSDHSSGLVLFSLISLAILMAVYCIPNAPQATTKLSNNVAPRQNVKSISEAEESLQTAIKFTEGDQNRSIGMKLTGYKYALQELEKTVQKYPKFKPSEIASLTAVFLSEKAVLEAELMKKEEEEKKAAEKKQRELEAKLKKLEKNFSVKKDEVEGRIFLRNKAFPVHTNSRSCIFPYIGKSGSHKWLRAQIQYTSDDWLFVERLIFSIDGEKIVKNFSHFDWQRDNGSGGIWEWVDLSADLDMETLLEKIANSKKTILRFEGRQYYNDLTISASDKKAILETMEYYRAF
jgi:hypothetical protein